ncbi:MAG: HAD family hydrolase [Lachnospiraceae bacterium]|nr:HAD family hydrolase [Lachnospiraceae bacterium]
MNIKLLIFDFDGTIMDTRKTIVIAKQETMRRMGLAIADEQTCAETIGLSAKIGFKNIYPELSDEMLDLCVQNYRKIFDDTKEKVPPTLFVDMVDTLNKLKDKGIVCTIATSRNGKSLKEFLDKMNITNFFSYLLAAEDTTLLKPNAEPVIKTLNDLSYCPEQTLVVGDMPIDILMGKNAGVYTCGVTYGNSDKDSLLEAGADYVIDGISELLDILSI